MTSLLKTSLAAVALAGLVALHARADITISNFNSFSTQLSSMEISWNNAGTDQFNQGAGFISIAPVGGGNPKGDGYFNAYMPGGSEANPNAGTVSLSGQLFFNLTARVDAGNASSILHILLYDDSFTQAAIGTFEASSFTSTFSSQSAVISLIGSGDITKVTYWRMDGDGIASDNFRYSFDNLSTTSVPEPSSYALGAGILLGLCIARREIRKRRAA
jgi:hypothetical protein